MSVFGKKIEEEAAEAEAAKIAQGAEEEGATGIGPDSYQPAKAEDEEDMEDMTPEEAAQLMKDVDEMTAPLSFHGEDSSPKRPEWPFTDTRYGNTHTLYLQVEKYYHGGLISLSSFDTEDMEPFAQYSVNVGAGLPDGHIAVKDWSEGEGNPEVLKANGVIEGEPVAHVPSGYVMIPIYALTAKFKEYLASL